MKRQLLLILLIVTPLISVNSQDNKNITTKGRMIKAAEKDLNRPIKAVTSMGVLFEKLHKSGTYEFIRTENDEFFFFFFFSRTWAIGEIEIIEGSPLIIYLEDGNEIILKSLNTSKGVQMIGSYYDISREQIEKLASNNIVFVRFYFVSEDNILDSEIDDSGTYFEFDVESNRNREWLTTYAHDILQ